MPVYEYQCPQCGVIFELKLGIFHRRKAERCPKCGGEETRRIVFSLGTYSADSGSCSTRGSG